MKIRRHLLALVAACAVFGAQAQHHGHPPPARTGSPSPYTADLAREIKGLSAEEIRAWREGQGAGMARPAELNRHPGPMHVLELADALRLDVAQALAARELMDRHKTEVRALGEQLVALERELDRLFAIGRPADTGEATRLAESIGLLAGRIRAAHLRTHIEQARLLTEDQVDRYHALRGYGK